MGMDELLSTVESVRHWDWGGGLGGLVSVLGGVSVVATSHTGPSVKPSRGRVVALSVGCMSSGGCVGRLAAAARLA